MNEPTPTSNIEWATAVIEQDAEPDRIGTAAKILLAVLTAKETALTAALAGREGAETEAVQLNAVCEQQAKRIEELEEEITHLMKDPSETMSEHPGCVYCMKAGTTVKDGEVCPVCRDRLPTKTEREQSSRILALEKALAECEDQATQGCFVEHECPAYFACGAIVVEARAALAAARGIKDE